MTWLNPGRWLLYLALLAALGVGIYRLDQSRQQIGYDKAQAEYTAAALKAEQVARAKEQELLTAQTKVEAEYAKHKKIAAADAGAAADELDRLRNELAITSAASKDSTPATGDHGTGGLERELLGNCSQTLQGVARETDRLAAKTVALQDYIKSVIGVSQEKIGTIR